MRSILNVALLLIALGITDASSPPRVKAKIHVEEKTRKDRVIAEVSQLVSKQHRSHRISPIYKLISQKLRSSSPSHATPSSNEGKWLSIDSQSGAVRFKRAFDRDAECWSSEECIIQAQVVVMPHRIFQLIELEVVVGDTNDNEPVFPVKALVLNVSESLSIGDSINLDAYQATDKDSGRNSHLRYSISSNSYFRLKHLVDEKNSSHLTLYVTKSPDHEAVEELELDVWARDAGSPVRAGEMKLKIKILDTNDNYPKFEEDHYTATLEENAHAGTTVAVVKANDADSGLFGKVRYEISSRNSLAVRRLAKIDANRGTVWLKEALDREKHDGLRILIEARDSDPENSKTGETWLTINVEDVNDNTPTIAVEFISQSSGDTVYVSESAPNGSYIAKVTVRDSDGGKNGETEVTITSIDSNLKRDRLTKEKGRNIHYFALTNDGFLMSEQEFDRETCSRYRIQIKACDRGVPPRCSRKEITVVILDVNEYSPNVQNPLKYVTLREDVYIGTEIAVISANDGDSENGYALTVNETGDIVTSHNGDVTFSITQGNYGVFTIGKRSGVIRVVSQLDREKRAEWKLTVSVRDGGTPYRESSCTLIVTVDDINDNAPMFLNPTVNNSQIYADVTTNTVITRIKATDFDTRNNGKITYYIVRHASTTKQGIKRYRNALSGNATMIDSYFILNPVSGDLRLNFSKKNMSNAIGEHTLQIRATDSGENPLFTEISLRVIVGEYGNGRMPSTDENVANSSIDFLVLAIALGCATLFLIFIIIGVIVKCRKMNREISMMNKTATTRKISHEKKKPIAGVPVSVPSDKAPIEKTDDTDTKTREADGGAKSAADKPPEGTFRSLSNIQLTLDVAGVPQINDTDSGKGESDVEAASLMVNDSKLYHQRQQLGAKCTDTCRIYGHSDECWMPTEEEINVPARHGAPNPCTLNYYDWDRLKPRYHSPERDHHSRKGSHCSYASSSNTDNGSFSPSSSTSHRNIHAASLESERVYSPRHHSATCVPSSAPLPYPKLPLQYTDSCSAIQQQGFLPCQYMDAVYEVNYSVQATGLCHSNAYPHSQTPTIGVLNPQQSYHVPYQFSSNGVPPSPSAQYEHPTTGPSFNNEPKVSMQEAREVFDGIHSLVV